MPTRKGLIAGIALIAAALSVTVGRAASPVLIAIGTISGFYEDFAAETAAPLENGVPGNRFGGIGSGITYIGGNLFLALPDRGPNALTFNPCNDSTTSYITRFHTLHVTRAPSDPGSTPLPFTMTPMLVGTTLMWSRQPLVYGQGCGLVGAGDPALNDNRTHYFTGRSDNFDAFEPSTNPADARLDPESIRVSNDLRHVYVSDEYGPYIYEFDRATGRRTKIFTLPPKFAVTNLSASGDAEISGNTSGRVANKGMEGLAITPDGEMLVGAMQSPLIQDGGDVKGGVTRIVTIEIKSGRIHEYAYQLDTGTKTTISDILAINGHEFLVDERDSKGLADDSQAGFKKIFRIDLSNAQDVSHLSGAANLAPLAVPKQLFLDVVGVLIANGMNTSDIPAKLEGITFGPDVTMGNSVRHTLFVGNDNDFSASVVNSKGTSPLNPNRLFAFAFTDSDLPGYVPQQFKVDDDVDHGDDRQ